MSTSAAAVVWTALHLTLALGPAGPAAAAPAEAAPPEREAPPADGAPDPARDEAAGAALARLMERGTLALSSKDARGPKRFHFVVRLALPAGRRGAFDVTEFVVVRSGERVGILVRSAEGLPYCFLTEGLFVLLDRAEPGRLVVYEQGAPDFHFGLARDEEGSVDVRVTHAKDARTGHAVLDVGAVLRAAGPNVRQSAVDPSTGTVVCRTARGLLLLTPALAAPPGGPGFRAFVARTAGGATLSVLEPAAGAEPPFDPSRVTARSVAALGLPTRAMAEEERAKTPLSVPPGYGADPKERAAAGKLASLLLPLYGDAPEADAAR